MRCGLHCTPASGTVAPEFERWLIQMGIAGEDGRIMPVAAGHPLLAGIAAQHQLHGPGGTSLPGNRTDGKQ